MLCMEGWRILVCAACAKKRQDAGEAVRILEPESSLEAEPARIAI
jgi:hypothetical protein